MSKRARSPVSENTIVNSLIQSGLAVASEDDLSDHFVDNISETDSELGLGFDDDTDNDPDYEASGMSSDESDAMPARSGRAVPSSSRSNVDAIIDEVATNPPFLHVVSGNDSDNDGNIDIIPDWTVVNENNDNASQTFVFSEVIGPKHCPPHDAPPISYFNLFFTVGLLTQFVNMTNKYAREYIRSHTHNMSPESRARDWKNMRVLWAQNATPKSFNISPTNTTIVGESNYGCSVTRGGPRGGGMMRGGPPGRGGRGMPPRGGPGGPPRGGGLGDRGGFGGGMTRPNGFFRGRGGPMRGRGDFGNAPHGGPPPPRGDGTRGNFRGGFPGRGGRGMDRGGPMSRGGRGGGGFQGRGGGNYGSGPPPPGPGPVKRGAPAGGPPMPAKRGRFDGGPPANGYSHQPPPTQYQSYEPPSVDTYSAPPAAPYGSGPSSYQTYSGSGQYGGSQSYSQGGGYGGYSTPGYDTAPYDQSAGGYSTVQPDNRTGYPPPADPYSGYNSKAADPYSGYNASGYSSAPSYDDRSGYSQPPVYGEKKHFHLFLLIT
ncbi:hypothetical protein J6590_065146 [Homalodisca vitripennis]|nr:hypothetical protein J6590_065146 [Homalodisca vitripennis]